MPSAITIDDSDVLLAIDLQADFMPGGEPARKIIRARPVKAAKDSVS